MTLLDQAAPRRDGPAAAPSGWAGRRRRAAWPLAVGALLLVAVVLAVLLGGKGNGLPLDPDGAGPAGSRALAQVLDRHGVAVRIVRSPAAFSSALAADRSATVMVSRTDLLSDADLDLLREDMTRTGRPVVVVQPSQRQLDVLAPGIRRLDVEPRTVVEPACSDPVPAPAGAADAGGDTYALDQPAAIGCYPVGGHPSYVVELGISRTTVIGQADLITNDRLAREGNAALAVGSLGLTQAVVWYAPTGLDAGLPPEGARRSLTSLLPSWVGWVTLQLLVVTGICMVWRGRRLGRLVPEPLPVVVRAVETTEGRARMYRRSRAHGRAAATLRAGALERLRERTGLARTAAPTEVVAVIAARTGIPGPDVAAMLLGPPPTDDAGLVRLAQTLDRLDREVRRP